MAFRVAAIYAAQPDMDYLGSSLRSIQNAVELILIGIDDSSNPDIPALPGEAEVVRGNWGTPERCISELSRSLAARGFSHALLMDPQDVYAPEELSRILAFVEAHPDVAQFQSRVQIYWKSPRYRIDPPDSTPRTVIFNLAPKAHHPGVVQIPEDVGTCHNFSFASPSAAVVGRLRSSGDVTPWRKSVWDAWNSNRSLRNLHPGQPSRWRAARRIQPANLPDSLARHPNLDDEISGGERARPPAFSLIFIATQRDTQSVRDFCSHLAATVPDDCELIGCAASDGILDVLASIPGLKPVRVSREAGRYGAWLAGSEVAASENLIFLTSDLSFEGDWVEGFIAGFERNEGCILLPRVQNPGADFEKQRGRHYGRQLTLQRPVRVEVAECWACTKESLNCLEELPVICLADTVVFRAGAGCDDVALKDESAGIRASIVIPLFNNLHLTKDCLASIFRHTAAGTYELLMVDNGSTDGSWEYLQSLLPDHAELRCIRNRRNLFFARGCNRGGWAARAENIVFLNNDTIVKPGWLEELLRPLEADDRVGITGNKQLFPDSHPACANRVWHAGMVVGEDKLPWHICYGFDPAHPAVNRQRDCQSVSGCCLAIRRGLFEQTRGFDPHFQNGFEDVDLCLRAGELGYRVVYTPHSEIVHMVSSSESRFDREASNLKKFRARWSEKLVPDEEAFLRDSGFMSEPSGAERTRIGFISTFNQKGAISHYAERLLKKYPENSYVVLAEFATRDRRPETDAANVIRCWDRTGTWYYPVLRWARTLHLSLIHVNFDSSLFPLGFLELLQALKKEGKRLVFTIHEIRERTPLLTGIAQLADAVIVEKAAQRLSLIRNGFAARTIRVIPSLDSDAHWSLYEEIQRGRPGSLLRIRWEGPQLVNHSLALVNREMETHLLQAEDVELTVVPVGKDAFAGSLNSEMRSLPAHYGRLLSGPVDVHVRHQWPPNWEPPAEGHWVVIQPWEYGGLPVEWIAAVNRHVDEVWAPTTFVRNLYVESGADPERVQVVPNGVDSEFFKPGVKPYSLKAARSFKFLFLGGTIHRKGIDLLLEAYSRAFIYGDDVSLVIKDTGVADVYRGQGMGQRIREMQSDPSRPHIVYLDRDLSDREMVQLYNACDCLVHPYRGEGFALPVLEAMACAKPVIVTAGGATDDFVDDETGFRIPARKQVFGDRSISGLKTAADLWMLEPDLDALTAALVHVFNNRESAREVGRRARAKVEAGWTWKQAAKKALDRIQALKTRPVFRTLRQCDAAVLIDLRDQSAVPSVVESLKRNSYASLELFVRANAEGLQQYHPDVAILEDAEFSGALSRIRNRVRAPYVVIVTEPLRFSKNWFRQLTEVAARVKGPRIVVPWGGAVDSSEVDDPEFQRLSRLRWRQYRGKSTEVSSIAAACVVMNWECLSLAGIGRPVLDTNDWVSQLRSNGARICLAEDTCVGRISSDGMFWGQTPNSALRGLHSPEFS